MENDDIKTIYFQPEKSRGVFFLIIGFILVIILFFILFLVIPTINFHTILIILIIFFVICIIFIINFYNLDNMQYIISPEHKLIIKWGFLVKELDLKTVVDVTFFPTRIYQGIRLGGLRLPGYSIGLFDLKVNEKDEKINMFATNFKSLVIITDQKEQKIKYYGITPVKPELFINELKKRIKL